MAFGNVRNIPLCPAIGQSKFSKKFELLPTPSLITVSRDARGMLPSDSREATPRRGTERSRRRNDRDARCATTHEPSKPTLSPELEEAAAQIEAVRMEGEQEELAAE